MRVCKEKTHQVKSFVNVFLIIFFNSSNQDLWYAILCNCRATINYVVGAILLMPFISIIEI